MKIVILVCLAVFISFHMVSSTMLWLFVTNSNKNVLSVPHDALDLGLSNANFTCYWATGFARINFTQDNYSLSQRQNLSFSRIRSHCADRERRVVVVALASAAWLKNCWVTTLSAHGKVQRSTWHRSMRAWLLIDANFLVAGRAAEVVFRWR